ncbi:hypothetical protein EOPP23_06845 [Endozoicomonas sp. OPT23]|uniref:hypothetical protein n=1 Tax=Endozoicomonas sp. OPT23 TaxID=2072845 RepID=UPI00129B33E8|nr:hypothetical protein [Endozoicomonas sp. OPT23]MRI32703.1 hypothetical protein [Endozoicomonas sp. OPT23]
MREFDDLIESENLTFKIAPEPDGSREIYIDDEAVDISWNWLGKNAEALKNENPDCIWTVLDCDGELYVTNGRHYVNRMFYMVSNEPYQGEMEDFIY